MTDHYYSQQPSVDHHRQMIIETIRGIQLKLMTDSGVFSKRGVDFGSRLLIEHVELRSNAQVLDIGCGYGPIGLFVASIVKDGHVTMTDINQRAVALAKENAEINGITNVRVLHSDLYTNLNDERFTAILTNPPIRAGKDVVYSLYEQSLDFLEDQGELWVVVQKKQGAPSTLKKLQQLFRDVEVVARKKGYFVYRAVR